MEHETICEKKAANGVHQLRTFVDERSKVVSGKKNKETDSRTASNTTEVTAADHTFEGSRTERALV